MKAFLTLQTAMGGVIETLILLDRYIYVKEKLGDIGTKQNKKLSSTQLGYFPFEANDSDLKNPR